MLSCLVLAVFSFNEAVWLRVLLVPLCSMSSESVASLQFKILPITGRLFFSWYKAQIISSYIEMICFSPFARHVNLYQTRNLLASLNKPGCAIRLWCLRLSDSCSSVKQIFGYFALTFLLEDDQQYFNLFGTSWLQSNRGDFPSHVRNPNTRFQLDPNIF